ncbi:unnamed protein product [Paramecium pentaurelia]|uniref:Serine hydroxymethyltransferase-like domain-containing protein n=1 Tax=Paramecium pentaurelia TaxID=43138 RepID=A0A8S1WUZ7_9CILI|nr:unnamed protein product [Paramecium pentaurelia]
MIDLHSDSKQTLQQQDIEVYQLIEKEKDLQQNSINLIPSENYTSRAVAEALSCVFSSRYAPGPQGSKYAPQVENYDEMEKLCQDRALAAFQLDSQQWGVNAQMGSGSSANLAIFLGLLEPKDRIMSMEFQQGGHFSHGYQIGEKKLSAISKIFEVLFYQLNEKTQEIDYDKVELLAKAYKPKLIVAGCSAYSKLINFGRFRNICDQVGAILLADIAHTSGLMSAGVIPSPFPYADIVMTTTHKSLRGPRGSLIYYKLQYKNRIDESVAPGLVAGAHFHTITAITVALKEALSPSYKQLQKDVVENNKHFAAEFQRLGFDLIAGGTENHLILLDLRKFNVDAIKMEYILSQINIQCNKQFVPFDTVTQPRALRIGSIPLSVRQASKEHFTRIAQIIKESVELVQTVTVDIKLWASENQDKLIPLKQKVVELANELPIPWM